MASVYKRTWSGQDGKERVRWVAVYTGSPELQHAIERLLDGSFKPRTTRKKNPKQLELFAEPLPRAQCVEERTAQN